MELKLAEITCDWKVELARGGAWLVPALMSQGEVRAIVAMPAGPTVLYSEGCVFGSAAEKALILQSASIMYPLWVHVAISYACLLNWMSTHHWTTEEHFSWSWSYTTFVKCPGGLAIAVVTLQTGMDLLTDFPNSNANTLVPTIVLFQITPCRQGP